MASNMIATSARFDPFSYNEMLAPVSMADTEHKAIQEDEGKLQTLTDAWKTKLNQTTDPLAYKQYSQYLDQLKQQASNLATNGLNPNSREAMMGLRSGYATNILPIEEAYTNRQKGVAFQNDLRARDNSVVFNQDFSNSSVDDFMKNPTLTSKYASGASVLAQVSNQAKAFADQLLSNPKSGLTKANHGYLMQMTKEGVDPAVIDQIINSDKADTQLKGIARQLKEIRDNAVHLSGVNDWGDDASINKMKGFGNQGLYAALGKTDIKYMDDWLLKFGMEQAARAKELQIPPANSYMPSTNTHFDINSGEGKDIMNLKNSMFDDKGHALASAFGEKGDKNPFSKKLMLQQEITKSNAQVIALERKRDSGTITMQEHKQLGALTTKVNNNLRELANTKKYYEKLEKIGIKPTDNFRTVREKLNNYQETTQHAYTNYDLKLQNPALERVDNDIRSKLTAGTSTLLPIDDNFKLKTGSNVSKSDFESGIVDDKKPNVIKIEFSPKLGGDVIYTQGGKKFLMTKGYSEEHDNLIKSLVKGSNTKNGRGLEYALQQAANTDLPIKTRREYMDAANDLSRKAAATSAHFYSGELDTQEASKESSKTLQQGFR